MPTSRSWSRSWTPSRLSGAPRVRVSASAVVSSRSGQRTTSSAWSCCAASLARSPPGDARLAHERPREAHTRAVRHGARPPRCGWQAAHPSGWHPVRRLHVRLRVKYFNEQARSDAHRLMERFLLVEKLTSSPWGLQELDLLCADGSKLETHYTPPKKRGDKVCNDELRPDRNGVLRCPITAPTPASSRTRARTPTTPAPAGTSSSSPPSKGTILARRCVPMNAPENGTLAGSRGRRGSDAAAGGSTALRTGSGTNSDVCALRSPLLARSCGRPARCPQTGCGSGHHREERLLLMELGGFSARVKSRERWRSRGRVPAPRRPARCSDTRPRLRS